MKRKYHFQNYYLGPNVPEIPSGDVELTMEEFFAIITNKKYNFAICNKLTTDNGATVVMWTEHIRFGQR